MPAGLEDGAQASRGHLVNHAFAVAPEIRARFILFASYVAVFVDVIALRTWGGRAGGNDGFVQFARRGCRVRRGTTSGYPARASIRHSVGVEMPVDFRCAGSSYFHTAHKESRRDPHDFRQPTLSPTCLRRWRCMKRWVLPTIRSSPTPPRHQPRAGTGLHVRLRSCRSRWARARPVLDGHGSDAGECGVTWCA